MRANGRLESSPVKINMPRKLLKNLDGLDGSPKNSIFELNKYCRYLLCNYSLCAARFGVGLSKQYINPGQIRCATSATGNHLAAAASFAMRNSLWLAVLALLAQASAGVTNKDLEEDAKKAVIFDVEDVTKEYTLEALVADANYTETEIFLSNLESTTNSGVDSTAAKPIYHNGTEDKRILGGTLIDDAALLVAPLNSILFVQTKNAAGIVLNNCGGVLLSSIWGLTAAHCVALATTINVYGGQFMDPSAGTPTSRAKAIIHPNFRLNFLTDNIALLNILTPLALGASVAPALLSLAKPATLDNMVFTTLGYGLADDNVFDPAAATLSHVNMQNMNKLTCNQQTLGIFVTYPANTGCLSTAGGTKGICKVDPGGPVFHTGPNDDVGKIIGINSQIVGCPRQEPSSFTWINPYIKWIQDKTFKKFT